MVLEHVEEDEDAVTKDKADEKQKKVIIFFYVEKKNFEKFFRFWQKFACRSGLGYW